MFVDYVPYPLMVLYQIVDDFLFFQQKFCDNIFLNILIYFKYFYFLNVLKYNKLYIILYVKIIYMYISYVINLTYKKYAYSRLLSFIHISAILIISTPER